MEQQHGGELGGGGDGNGRSRAQAAECAAEATGLGLGRAAFGQHSGGGRAETEAAYRFFDNPQVTFDAILAPHRQATLARMRQQQTVILVQDTSEIELTRPEQQVAGAGPLDEGSRRGCFVHPLLALTPQGLPLGTVSAACWTRDEAPPVKLDKAARVRQRKNTPIEDKESLRWVTGLHEAHAVDDRGLLPGAQAGLPDRMAAVRACGPRDTVPGGGAAPMNPAAKPSGRDGNACTTWPSTGICSVQEIVKRAKRFVEQRGRSPG